MRTLISVLLRAITFRSRPLNRTLQVSSKCAPKRVTVVRGEPVLGSKLLTSTALRTGILGAEGGARRRTFLGGSGAGGARCRWASAGTTKSRLVRTMTAFLNIYDLPRRLTPR